MTGIEHLEFPARKFFVDLFQEDIYMVGGTVRDFLLNGEISPQRDLDLIVTHHSYEQIEERLSKHGKTNTVGRSFAVVKFSYQGETYDISVPRRDFRRRRDAHGHKNFAIQSDPAIPLEVDLSRRDFTCNSIAVRLSDHRLVDPFNGVEAIRNRRLVMTNAETFQDDPLRILRCARFSSVLGFSVDPAIYECSQAVPLDDLSAERVQEELMRLLLESAHPSSGLGEYLKLGVLGKLFPDLYRLALTIQDARFHPETDEDGHHTVWIHTLYTVDIARRLADSQDLSRAETLTLLLAALLHDIGKAETTRWEYKRGRMTVTSLYHDARGVAMAEDFLKRWRIDSRWDYPVRDTVLKLIANHHRVFDLFRNRETIGFKAISRLVRDMEGRDFLLLLLDLADRNARTPPGTEAVELDEVCQWYLEKKKQWNISQDTIQPLIMGRDLLELGVPSGREMGHWLDRLYDLQLDGLFQTRDEGLALFKKLMAGESVTDSPPESD